MGVGWLPPRATLKKPVKSASRPQTFEVAGHQVLVTERDGAWYVAVDQTEVTRRFETAADAWTAGVGVVDRLDAFARAGM